MNPTDSTTDPITRTAATIRYRPAATVRTILETLDAEPHGWNRTELLDRLTTTIELTPETGRKILAELENLGALQQLAARSVSVGGSTVRLTPLGRALLRQTITDPDVPTYHVDWTDTNRTTRWQQPDTRRTE